LYIQIVLYLFIKGVIMNNKWFLLVLISVLFTFVFTTCEDKGDTTPPTVSIISPDNSTQIFEVVKIKVETDDNKGIEKVEFFIDDSLHFTDNELPYEYEWNTTSYQNESEHSVYVISYDVSGNSTKSEIKKYVVNNSFSLPTPSQISEVIYKNGSFKISWTKNNDNDFTSYKLYQSLSEDMSNKLLVKESNNILDTTSVIVKEGVKYHQLFVEDKFGLSSGSGIKRSDYLVELWGTLYSVDITELNIQNQQLNQEIPSEIGILTNLENLQLRNNQLIGKIPPEIGNLTNLKYLSIGKNQLSGDIPPEIGNLTNLIHFYSTENKLSGSIPKEIGNLTNVTYLELGFNELTGSIPKEIGNMSTLFGLTLRYNKLSGGIPEEIGNLNGLEQLDLDSNQLTGTIPSSIFELQSLIYLQLGKNQLTGEISSQIGDLTNLTVLQLQSNQFSGEIPSEIGNLTKLRMLFLNSNKLTGEIPSEIGGLTKLTNLMLNDNQLSGTIPTELGNLTNLTTLWLGFNQLSGQIPESLCGLGLVGSMLLLEKNKLCPPYPDCLSSQVGEQDTSDCN